MYTVRNVVRFLDNHPEFTGDRLRVMGQVEAEFQEKGHVTSETIEDIFGQEMAHRFHSEIGDNPIQRKLFHKEVPGDPTLFDDVQEHPAEASSVQTHPSDD